MDFTRFMEYEMGGLTPRDYYGDNPDAKRETKTMRLFREKSKPGSAVQRFGNWRKGEPSVIVDNQTWLSYGKPDFVDIAFEQDFTLRYEKEYVNGSEERWEDEGGIAA